MAMHDGPNQFATGTLLDVETEPTLSDTEANAFLASLPNSSDPILTRRNQAILRLNRVGLLTSDELESVGGDVGSYLSMDVRIGRVLLLDMLRTDGSTTRQERAIFGGYRTREDGTVDAVVHAREIHSDQALTLFGLSVLATGQAAMIVQAGEDRRWEQDIYEVLVADGRDRGMPVVDLYRPADEPPVTGVRNLEPPVAAGHFALTS